MNNKNVVVADLRCVKCMHLQARNRNLQKESLGYVCCKRTYLHVALDHNEISPKGSGYPTLQGTIESYCKLETHNLE